MDEWEPIPLSCLSQAAYCLRRAALLTIEQQWVENADTAKGRLEHKNAHTARVERRGSEAKLFEYPVFSDALNLSGKCDCIEVRFDKDGCHLPAVDFPAALYPVEFKHGKVRDEEEYEIQLCAQAMCLEEMYQTAIPEGAIFYISSHRRYPVAFTDALRGRVRDTVAAVEEMRRRFSVPPALVSAKCTRCSLREVCLPDLQSSAAKYLEKLTAEAKEVITL